MTRHQRDVLKFHAQFNVPIEPHPTIPAEHICRLRLRLLREEVDELEKALFEDRSIVDVADALADIQYVLDGTAISFGIDLEPISDEVHRSNMTKVWSDGEVHKDAGGKVIKPDSYSPANIAPILAKQ